MTTEYNTIHGWFDYEDVFNQSLTLLSKRLNRRLKIVEIGAWLGKSSFYLVENHSDKADIFIVDNWLGAPSERSLTHKLATEKDIFVNFMSNMKVHWGKFIPLRCFSTEAAKLFGDSSIDFVFIDGDHTYEAVKLDILAWLPKLSSQGIIAGHDFTNSFPGVVQAVTESFDPNYVVRIGRSWVCDLNIARK